MLYVIAVFVTVAANSSILATETAATGESLLSVHRLILIVACSAACLVVIVTTLAVIATQRQDYLASISAHVTQVPLPHGLNLQYGIATRPGYVIADKRIA